MDRRCFIRGAACATGACFVEGLGAQRSGIACPPLGVQLYTLRDALQRDAMTVLRALREIGIRELEIVGIDASSQLFGMTARQFRTAAEDNGLKIASAHIGDALTEVGPIGERLRELGADAVFVALPSEFAATVDGRFELVGARSLEQLDGLAERLNRAGRAFSDQGLTFGYHNHHVEFRRVGDEVAFDYLLARTDPDVVKIELDVGWAAFAGADVVEILSRYARRVVAFHLKDVAATAAASAAAQEAFVEPGAGVVDFAAILARGAAIGVAHGFIEIDIAADPLAAVERGAEHLRAICAP